MNLNIFDVVIKVAQFLFKQQIPLARAFGFFGVLMALWQAGTDFYGSIISRLDGLMVVALGSADFRPLAFVNFVFPLSDFLAFLTAYLAVYLVAACIRIIKAWIPTVA